MQSQINLNLHLKAWNTCPFVSSLLVSFLVFLKLLSIYLSFVLKMRNEIKVGKKKIKHFI
jgi:hypothetical protein